MSCKLPTAAFLAAQCVPILAAPVVEIKKIAGKPETEVSRALGPSAKCKTIKQGKKCAYRSDQIEVVFIGGKADWITISGLSKTMFSPIALTAIGLNEDEPTFRTAFVIRWEPTQGFRSVSIFNGATGGEYAYVKFKTP